MPSRDIEIAVIVYKYIGLPAPEQTPEKLAELCNGDTELLGLVKQELAPSPAPESSAPPLPPAPLPPALPAISIPGYRLLRWIGRGAMGEVYEAVNERLTRHVALKLLRSGATDEEVERFKGEARALARLNHPNIVQVYDAGVQGETLYLALELIEGGTLKEHLAGRALPPREAAAVIEVLAQAVAYVHEQRVIHRDLKPANVLLVTPPAAAPASVGATALPADLTLVLKITDFGIAKKADETGHTEPGALIGTPAYMSPEQATGKTNEIGPATDIYALGVILYECLAGHPPFGGVSHFETIQQITNAAPPPIWRQRPEIPRDLETICLKCLEKEPNRRYNSAKALADDLLRFLGGMTILARPVGPLGRTWRWARRNRAVAAALAAIFALISIAAGVGIAIAFHLNTLNKSLQDEIAQKDAAHYDNNMARAEAELIDDRDIEDAERLLAEAPEGPRGWEYYHLAARLARPPLEIGKPEPGQEADVSNGNWQATFNPSGTLVAVAHIRGGVTLHDARDGTRVGRPLLLKSHLPISVFPFYGVAFSPDGRLLAGATTDARKGLSIPQGADDVDNVVVLWDVPTGAQVGTLPGHTNIVRGVAFSPDGRLLASGGYDRLIKLWDVASQKEVATFKGHTGWVNAVAFHPAGQVLASAGADGEVRLWDVATGGLRHTFLGHRSPAQWVAFSPDGDRLASVGMDGVVRIWDVANRKALRELKGHLGPVLGVAYSPDGTRLATCGFDRTVKLWDADSGRLLLTLRGHTDMIWSVEFARDGSKLVSAGYDATARVWEGGPHVNVVPQLSSSTGSKDLVNKVAFHPDGREYAVGGWDGKVTVFDAESREQRFALGDGETSHRGPIWGLCYDGKGERIATASWDGTAAIWELATKKRTLINLRVRVGCHAVAFSPDGTRLAVGTIDGKCYIHDAATGQEVRRIDRGFSYLTYTVAYSPDGRWILTGGYTSGVFVWNAETGELVRALGEPSVLAKANNQPDAHVSSVYHLAFSKDGKRLASVSWDKKVLVWDVPGAGAVWPEKPKPKHRFLHNDYVTCASFSPDSRFLATGSLDKTVRFWDLDNGRAAGAPHPLRGMVWGVAWHPQQNKVLASHWYRREGVAVVTPP
jgi:eukaryotic-like serine/threonine-protein kinase